MPQQPFSPLSLALALLVAPPSFLSGQTQQRITVEYQNAPLSEVVRGFAAFSGRTIGVAPDVGDPLVTALVRDVDWLVGFDQILETQSLVARPQGAGVVRVERRRAVTIDFQDAPLSHVVRALASYSGRTITLPPDLSDPRVSFAARNVDWQRALDDIVRANGFIARFDAAGVIRIERVQQAPAKPEPLQ